ncbi:hypothetical protein DSO57_1038117 [Entomophthora muscae]|uniref:Uncharacterized protein n=1 Tax=Entomophthora muscae TaxID=34485 RepID=A0ACC2U8K6_9FUNG|nr:hypothetical protein DSO57_1038117 [Entomophthora muscae]
MHSSDLQHLEEILEVYYPGIPTSKATPANPPHSCTPARQHLSCPTCMLPNHFYRLHTRHLPLVYCPLLLH